MKAGPFFLLGEVADPGYRNIRDLPHNVHHREFVEQIWKEFEHLAEPKFRAEACIHFQERFWEMYLAVSMIRRGIDVQRGAKAGPDFLIPGTPVADQDVLIEATTSGPGMGPDAVPELNTRGKIRASRSVPEELILLRFRNSIEEKLDQYKRAVSSGIVDSSMPYIIALNGIRIQEALFESTLHFIVKAVYPFGALSFTFDRESGKAVDSGYQFRPEVTKESGAVVSTSIFESSQYESISAVLYAWCDCANRAKVPGDEFIMVHNEKAKHPLPLGFLPFGREYWIDEQYLHRKDWSEDHLLAP